MRECICSSCANLKGVIEENGSMEKYECEFGFPSEDCLECVNDQCEAECGNYISDEEERIAILKCSGCGRELKQYGDDQEDGEVYCVDCYMKEM